MPTRQFYTIGYSGRKPEEFLSLLKAKDIKAIVDVRLRPDNERQRCYVKTQSSDKGIEALLKTAGIEYFFLVELGNIFRDYRDWQERYKLLLERAGDLLVERFDYIPTPFCLLCAEINPVTCHRELIAKFLEQKGYTVEHLGQISEAEECIARKIKRKPKPRTYIDNIRHFLDKNGDFPNIMPNPARKMAVFLTRIISLATEAFSRDRVLVSMQCNRKGCHEEILVWLNDLNKDIEWFCPECGDNGFISNWRGTKWDKTSSINYPESAALN